MTDIITDDQKRRKTDSMIYMWLPKIVEAGIVILLVFVGMRFTLNNVVSKVDKLEATVGTSSGRDGNLCERTTRLETYMLTIQEELKSINMKLDARGR